ncbi:MAG: hypothetical protein ACNFW9_02220 [Candidatus Kerfeldbacteria bacterium]|jgi:2-phosphoglycerate kinase
MYVFIGGVPTTGKTHLVKDFIKKSKLNILHVEIDDIRDKFKNDVNLIKWVNFFRDQDEDVYWQNTSCQKHIENVVRQSEELWPHILEQIINIQNKHEHVIFEGVQLMPRLTRKFLKMNGFFLIPPDIETIYIRLVAHKRWGVTNDQKRNEAKCFFEGDAKYINTEARKFGYKVFDNTDEGYSQLYKWFN